MADLPADSIAVVIPHGQVGHPDSIAILQPDTTAIVTVKILVILSVSIEAEILDYYVFEILAAEERKERRTGRLARYPNILAQRSIELEAVTVSSYESSFQIHNPTCVWLGNGKKYPVSQSKSVGGREGDFLVIPIRIFD